MSKQPLLPMRQIEDRGMDYRTMTTSTPSKQVGGSRHHSHGHASIGTDLCDAPKDLPVRMSLHALRSPMDPECPSSGYILQVLENPMVNNQIAQLKDYSRINQQAMFAALIFVAIMISLCIANTIRFYHFTRPGGKAWEDRWDLPLHYIEFWTNAFFNVVTGVVLINATSDTFHDLALRWPTVITFFALFDIVSSFVGAILISIDLEYFERLCHNVEYAATLFMSVVQYMLWLSLAPRKSSTNRYVLPFVPLPGISMLLLYNTLDDPYNEFASHSLEFPWEVIGGLVIFYTAAESKRKADMAILNVMYKPCDTVAE